MLPEDIFELQETEVSSVPRSGKVVYKYDFTEGRHVLVNGRFVPCTPEEALAQWVEMCIRTQMDSYPIYKGTSFGLNLRDKAIGRKPSDTAYLVALADIQDRLLINPDILGINDLQLSAESGTLKIQIELETVLGSLDSTIQLKGGI